MNLNDVLERSDRASQTIARKFVIKRSRRCGVDPWSRRKVFHSKDYHNLLEKVLIGLKPLPKDQLFIIGDGKGIDSGEKESNSGLITVGKDSSIPNRER